MPQDRPVGPVIDGWTPPAPPQAPVLDGRYARLEPLVAADHAAPLFAAMAGQDWIWDYIPVGPFASRDAYAAWMEQVAGRPDPHFLAIRNKEVGGAPVQGAAAFMRITPDHGVIEVGSITFSPALQQTRAATEAMVLMMDWAFSNGYRRYEWKCDALNRPSRRAAQRLGFSYEGTFRQHMVIKGRNRDTAWFAVTDAEWPALRTAQAAWLDPGNFDAEGRQRRSLAALTGPVRVGADPTL